MTTSFLPAYTTPARNRRVLLTACLVGIPEASHFALDEAPVDLVGDDAKVTRCTGRFGYHAACNGADL